MEYTFNFQLKGGDPCKVTVEAESYDAAFQKLCALPGQFHIWRDRGYIELIPYPELLSEEEQSLWFIRPFARSQHKRVA
jgi:hypothetical protein